MSKDAISKLTCTQVADILKKRLSNGEYSSEKALPSYRAIASELKVSLSVCQRAMGQLRREGLVRISQGRAGELGDPRGLEDDYSFFGVIHPYNPEGDFGRILNAQILHVFASVKPISFPLIASSLHSEESELKYAKQMQHNRMRGILLSPANGSGNGAFFAELSRKMPVMLFDQELPGSGLPLVKFDYSATGNSLGCALKHAKRKRLLMLVQENPNRSLLEFAAAVEEKISTAVYPMEFFSHVADSIVNHDPAILEELMGKIAAAIRESQCDSLFCPYDSLLDTLIVNGLPEKILDGLQLATLNGGSRSRPPSLRYLYSDIWQWQLSHAELIGVAVHRLMRWMINSHQPVLLKKIPMKRIK